jgi:N-glycosylase/DNA lyase
MNHGMRLDMKISPLDLDLTLGCGQTFRWRKAPDGSWEGPLGNQFIRLGQNGSVVRIEAFPGGREVDGLVRTHLRGDDDVRGIQKALAEDPVIAAGIPELKGLRLVKIDEWECLMSFILATYANIPRITKMIETLSTRYGEKIVSGVNSFPSQDRLGRVPLSELAKCGFGYRAKYIHQVCKALDESALRKFQRMSFEDLRGHLKELPGVGDKVADCVSLFGFGRLEAFPIDVWIERALGRLYHRRGSYNRLREFAYERFGPNAGYAQEYLYYNERLRATRGTCMFSEE